MCLTQGGLNPNHRETSPCVCNPTHKGMTSSTTHTDFFASIILCFRQSNKEICFTLQRVKHQPDNINRGLQKSSCSDTLSYINVLITVKSERIALHVLLSCKALSSASYSEMSLSHKLLLS